MTGKPAEPVRPTPHPPSSGPAGTAAAKGQLRRRDWIAIGVVAAIAAGLGIYLLARPGDPSPDAALPVTVASSSTRAGTADPTSPAATTGTEPMGASSAAGSRDAAAPDTAPADPAQTGRDRADSAESGSAQTGPARPERSQPGSAQPDDDVVASAVQPPGVTTARKAGPIGPFGDLSRRVDGDPLALGSVDAPVVMVEFADYRCPFCAKFSRTHEPVLIKKYVDTGIMRIEWRDLPIFGPESERAAIAGRAAAAQGKFWEFNSAVYAAAPQTGHPDLSVQDLVDFAAEAGVPDLDRFRADLDDPSLKAAVAKDVDQATVIGVPSTPAFVINGYPMVGTQPIEDFYQLIDTIRSLQ